MSEEINKEKEILGKEVLVEYELDTCTDKTIFIPGFVARVDKNKGLTVKALDNSRCPYWMLFELTEEEEISGINLVCINTIEQHHKDSYKYWVDLIYRKEVVTIADMNEIRKNVGFMPSVFDVQSACAFNNE